MKLSEMQSAIYDTMGYPTSPGTDVTRRVLRYINAAYKDLFTYKQFYKFRRRLVQVSSVADTPFMAFPLPVSRVLSIQDRTNDRILDDKPLMWIRHVDPGLTSVDSNPWAFAVYDLASPVARQPSNASAIEVVSSDAADTNVDVNFQTLITGNHPSSFVINTNGGTGVPSARNDITLINKVWLTTAAQGVISIYEDAFVGGTLLGVIPIGRTSYKYSVVHLYPTPSAAVDYYADVEVSIEDLVAPNEEPLIDDDFHDWIVMRARAKEFRKREKVDLARAEEEEARAMLSRLFTRANKKFGPESSNERARFSQLGPYYEEGT